MKKPPSRRCQDPTGLGQGVIDAAPRIVPLEEPLSTSS
jgi:hypothetical protein